MILFFRSVMKRSMISATAMIDATSRGQIGQPAPWMISNNFFPSHDDGGHFSLRKSFQQGSRDTANSEHYGASPINQDGKSRRPGHSICPACREAAALIHISCG